MPTLTDDLRASVLAERIVKRVRGYSQKLSQTQYDRLCLYLAQRFEVEGREEEPCYSDEELGNAEATIGF